MILWSGARIRVFLEDDEVLQQIEEALRLEHATDERFQLQGRGRCVGLAIDAAPQLEPLLVGGERADAGLQPIAHHQGGVVLKEGGNLGFVGLQLGVGAPDGGAFSGGVLELDQAQGQPVEEHHQVGPAVVLALAHGELVHHQPVVGGNGGEVDQPHMVAGDAAIGPGVFHRHALAQQAVEGAVGLHQRRRGQAQQLAQGLFPGLLRNGWVEAADGLAEAAHQHHIAE